MRWTSNERTGELVIAGVLFCIGFFWIIESLHMPHGTSAATGPGFFPTWLGILLCVVSFALSVQTFLSKAKEEVKIGRSSIWFTFIAMVVVAVFFEYLGFILTIALFVGFLLKILSRLQWITCILCAIVAAVGAYWVFKYLLGIQLPSPNWF